MPQISQLAATYSSQIFWLLVFFGLVFFVIGRGMVPKILGAVVMRDKQISSDLAAAEAARANADAEEEAWRKRENDNRAAAQSLIGVAKADAAAKAEKKLAAANKRIDKKMADAEAKIAEARNAALVEIEDVAGDAAQDIVARLAGIKVTAASAKSAVKEALSHG